MVCPNWKECFHEDCCKAQVCFNVSFWAEYWKNRPSTKNCPYVHLCSEDSCRVAYKCQDKSFWTHKERKDWKKEHETPSDKSIRRKKRKVLMKTHGKKRGRWEERREYHASLHANTPPCIKSQDTACDKKEACKVLNQCVVTLSRVTSNPELLNALRGPYSLDDIIKVLHKYDPKPMRSYYFSKK